MATLTQRAATFLHTLRLTDVPADVQRLARWHLADAIGVAMGATSVPAHRAMLTQLLAEQPAGGACTTLGFALPQTAPVAALLNGTSMHSLEYDDTHMGSIVHGSAVIVPAAWAACEAQGRDMDELVRLVVAGWELLVRLGQASPGGFQRRGFQVTSVGGVVVAALLAAAARGLSPALSVHAAGIAGSQAGGIFAFLSNGATVKALHPGWAAHGGLWAAAYAAAGMTGPDAVLEDRFGLFATYADDAQAGPRMHAELDSLGQAWRLREAAFKLHPVCHYIHAYLECAERLRRSHGATLADAREIHCLVAPGAAPVICEPWSARQQPRHGHDAKYSLPYCLALALLGKPVDIAAMTGERMDEQALALAQRMTWSAWDDSGFPARFGAHVRLVLPDGTAVTEQVAQVAGSAERPADESRLRAKFLANVGTRLAPTAAEAAWVALTSGAPLRDWAPLLASVA